MNRDYGKHLTEGTRPSSSGSDGNAKAGGKRKRVTGTPHRRHQRAEDIPWTAARCNRLLRTITSRIHILRRLSENNFADKAAAKKSPARRKIIFHPEGNEADRISPDCVENVRSRLAALPALESPTKDVNDPDWFPEDGRKASQKTYAGRGGNAKKVKLQEPISTKSYGIVDFRSPFIKKILRTDAANSPVHAITDTPRRLTSQRIVLDPKTHAERALRTLLDSFSTVLNITAGAPSSSRMGARSLRDTCLRRIPQYIDWEQKCAYDEEEYDFDASESMYVEIEKQLGTGSQNGLRVTVRAHAVKMIVDAFDERSWPVESLDRLLDVCERNQAVAEGQQILRSWFWKAEGLGMNRMARLLAWSKILDCTGFFFGVLREMLMADSGSLEEFNECPGIWQELLRAMARKSSRTNAVDFLERYIVACLSSADTTAAETTGMHGRLRRDEVLQNVVALTMALCWTMDEVSSTSVSAAQGLSSLVYRMAINAYHFNNARLQGIGEQGTSLQHSLRTMEPVLYSSIVLYTLDANGRTGKSLNAISDSIVSHILPSVTLSDDQQQQITRAEFVCSTAKCIAHASQDSADDFIEDVSTSLLLFATQCSHQMATSFKRLATTTAVAWAEYRANKSSYNFADEIERAAYNAVPGDEVQYTPRSNPRTCHFRWEEAIGEWIAATPLAAEKGSQPPSPPFRGPLDGLSVQVSGEYAALPEQIWLRMDVGKNIVKARQEDAHPEPPRELNPSSDSSIRAVSPLSPGDTSQQQKSDQVKNVAPTQSPASDSPDVETIQSVEFVLNSEPVELAGHDTESPLQAKTLRRIPELLSETEQFRLLERDELSTVRYTETLPADKANVAKPSMDEITPPSPMPSRTDLPSQNPLAFRPRPSTSRRAEIAVFAERDELAITPAQPTSRSTPEIEAHPQYAEPPPAASRSPERDELAATPAKPAIHSTRVLRSAMKKPAQLFQSHVRVDPRDELAMMPARQKKAKPSQQTSARHVLPSETAERDELGTTPRASRTLRSRVMQRQKTKSRGKIQRVDSSADNKPAKMPLGIRSANIRSAAEDGRKDGSDDELGL